MSDNTFLTFLIIASVLFIIACVLIVFEVLHDNWELQKMQEKWRKERDGYERY